MIKVALYYHHQYLSVSERLKLQQEQWEDIQHRLKDITALDQKYAAQLDQSRETVSQLERDVSAGKRRLQYAGSCSATTTPASTGVDVAATPGSDDAIKRNYFTLRERIATTETQIAGLQEYIRTQCLK